MRVINQTELIFNWLRRFFLLDQKKLRNDYRIFFQTNWLRVFLFPSFVSVILSQSDRAGLGLVGTAFANRVQSSEKIGNSTKCYHCLLTYHPYGFSIAFLFAPQREIPSTLLDQIKTYTRLFCTPVIAWTSYEWIFCLQLCIMYKSITCMQSYAVFDKPHGGKSVGI